MHNTKQPDSHRRQTIQQHRLYNNYTIALETESQLSKLIFSRLITPENVNQHIVKQ